MILATLNDGSADGRLIVVSPDRTRYRLAPVPSLREALERWREVEPELDLVSDFPERVDPSRLGPPMRRCWQWLDASAYQSHGDLMDKALGIDKPPGDFPLMYQGASDHFYGPNEDVPFPTEELGIDFEGEFGVIVDEVPMGTSAEKASKHIKLVVLVNDWSLRTLAGPEMRTGFGWIWAKPHCSVAPFAVTPRELGDAWHRTRVCLDLHVDWNGQRFGRANGEPMAFGFDELVARAARTRSLTAGTLIGSGTVSNPDYREVGSSCIAERRGIEIIDEGKPKTSYMSFGDRVRLEALTPDGASPFGAIEQKVIEFQPKGEVRR